ncbi:MAG: M15 family metallopeptidase [Mucinivorans sp.]
MITTRDTISRSIHSFGRTVDINPYNNPAIVLDGRIIPSQASYDPSAPDPGWRVCWTSLKDYMHFEKKIPSADR